MHGIFDVHSVASRSFWVPLAPANATQICTLKLCHAWWSRTRQSASCCLRWRTLENKFCDSLKNSECGTVCSHWLGDVLTSEQYQVFRLRVVFCSICGVLLNESEDRSIYQHCECESSGRHAYETHAQKQTFTFEWYQKRYCLSCD